MKPELWHEIHQLFHIQGLKKRAIARRLGIHRRTVRQALKQSRPEPRAILF